MEQYVLLFTIQGGHFKMGQELVTPFKQFRDENGWVFGYFKFFVGRFSVIFFILVFSFSVGRLYNSHTTLVVEVQQTFNHFTRKTIGK